jgi:sugar phosphate isomerase/epimerase
MRLSYCTWGMMHVPITELIPAVARIGYRGIELAVTPGWPTDLDTLDRAARQQIRDLCRSHGLAISAVAGHTSVCEDDPDRHAANMVRLRRTIDLAAEVCQDGEQPIVCSLLGGHVDDWGRVKERVAERVCELGDYAARRGVIFACEPHSGTAFDLPRKASWLMEQVRHPAVWLNFDISHFDILAIPAAECVPQMVPYSVHTHVKDQRGIYPYHEFLTPGAGPFDFVEYLSLMHAGGYGGWIGMEISVMVQRKPGYDPFVDAALGYYALRHAFCLSGAPLEE